MNFERFEIVETLSRRHSVQTYRCRDAELGDIVLKVFEDVSGEQMAHLRALSDSLGVRYSDAELMHFMKEVLEALIVAHTASPPLVHRDIKPENLVHAENGWVLIDFGASREAMLGDGEVSVIGTTRTHART